MADLTIRLEFKFASRSLRIFLAAAMSTLAATEVASENVTLTTYYPAPSGVYTQMITTNNTFLARDTAGNGGQLVIGANAVAAGHMVDVYSYKTGGNNTAIRARTPGALGGIEFGAIANRGAQWSAVYANQGGGDYAGYFQGNIRVTGSVQGDLNVNGGLNPTSAVKTASAGCSAPANMRNSSCPGGRYITTIGGVYSKWYTFPFYRYAKVGTEMAISIDAVCCPCPSGGCTL